MRDRHARKLEAEQAKRLSGFATEITAAKTIDKVLDVIREYQQELIKSPDLVNFLKLKVSREMLEDSRVESSLKFIKERFKERYPEEAKMRGIMKLSDTTHPNSDFEELKQVYDEKQKAKAAAKDQKKSKVGSQAPVPADPKATVLKRQ